MARQPPGAAHRAKDPLFVEAAARAFRVLEVFSADPGPLSLGEIARAAGLGRSAVQRSVHTLLRLGYLRQSGPRGGVTLGLRIFDRSFDCFRSDPLFERAMPLLIELRRETDERADLSVFDDLTMLYVLRLQSRRETFRAGLAGSRIPTFCSSAGVAVLSQLPDDEVEDILTRSDRRRITPYTVTELPAIREKIAVARRAGFALASQELQIGIVAVAAPVLDAGGRPVAAIHITASLADRSPQTMCRQFGPLVAEAARAAGNA